MKKKLLRLSLVLAAICICLVGISVGFNNKIINPNVKNCTSELCPSDSFEHIIQSCDTPTYWWQEWFFTDSLHYKYANEIYYMETYEDYFALLNEFYPIELPANATDYDRYKASVIQFDSLMSFPGDEGATIQIYLYESYNQAFTHFTQQRIIDILKDKNLYSSEVDSAWSQYVKAMETVIDSVVMYRPQCLGTLSGMEFVSFIGFLNDSYANSLLETLFYKEMEIPHHMTITDDIINAAYDSLRAHQIEPVTEYEDILECYVPVETRIDAINQDQIAWDEFINVRNSFERKLFGLKKCAYHNATNNLKWRKLLLLKNEYKYFGIGPVGYHDNFLPLDCSDEKLLEFDYYKEIVLSGNHRH